jgi:hypothetical protein
MEATPESLKRVQFGVNWPVFRIEIEVEFLKRQIHCVFVIRSLDKLELAL